jgi:5-formyltetrahydrofolate cyclo-ligase
VCDALLESLADLNLEQGYVGLYAAMGSELKLDQLAVACGERGYRIAYPAVLSETEMGFYSSEPPVFGELRTTVLFSHPGRVMAPEQLASLVPVFPEHIRVLVVPAIAYDREGYRLGQGGGYYDRYIREIAAHAVTWGAGFAAQMLDSVPRECHDARLERVFVA